MRYITAVLFTCIDRRRAIIETTGFPLILVWARIFKYRDLTSTPLSYYSRTRLVLVLSFGTAIGLPLLMNSALIAFLRLEYDTNLYMSES